MNKKMLYIDCPMGAAGDMLTGALFALFEDREAILKELDSMGLPDSRFDPKETDSHGVKGMRLSVIRTDAISDDSRHRNMDDIKTIIEQLNISEKVRNDILNVYDELAEAESEVHETFPERVHFHEVGSLSSIADVCAFSLLIDKLGVNEVFCSTVHVGKGTVKCAHGILPVPTPATAILLRDIPHYSADVEGELCTPTAAAILKTHVTGFGDMPKMKIERSVCGTGTRDCGRASYVKMSLGYMTE